MVRDSGIKEACGVGLCPKPVAVASPAIVSPDNQGSSCVCCGICSLEAMRVTAENPQSDALAKSMGLTGTAPKAEPQPNNTPFQNNLAGLTLSWSMPHDCHRWTFFGQCLTAWGAKINNKHVRTQLRRKRGNCSPHGRRTASSPLGYAKKTGRLRLRLRLRQRRGRGARDLEE